MRLVQTELYKYIQKFTNHSKHTNNKEIPKLKKFKRKKKSHFIFWLFKKKGNWRNGALVIGFESPVLCSAHHSSTCTSWLKSIFGLMLTSAFVLTFCIFSTSVSASQIFLLYLFALKRQAKSNQKGVWLGHSDNCPLVGMREWMVQWTPSTIDVINM